MTIDPKLWQTAIHESGHTIAALALNARVERVTIIPAQGSRGRAEVRLGSSFSSILIAASGRIAEEIEFSAPVTRGNDTDRARVDHMQGGIPWEAYCVVSRTLLGMHWPTLLRLAHVLIEKRELSGDEVLTALGAVLPEQWVQDVRKESV